MADFSNCLEKYRTLDQVPDIEVPDGFVKAPPGLHHMRTLFGEVPERNVVFCIDTSGSMYHMLGAVKQHLTESLLKHAFREGKTKFNVFEFNSEISQWADGMVDCSVDAVTSAAEWINKLEVKSSSRILPVLVEAFRESDVGAVYLVTDGYPDQDVKTLLEHIKHISRGRPVHTFLLTEANPPNHRSAQFLESLAKVTYGSFRIVSVVEHGAVQRITPIYQSPHCARPAPRLLIAKQGYKNPRVPLTAQLTTDPLSEPVVTAASVSTDPYTLDASPFYHGYNHWCWPGLPSMMGSAWNGQLLGPLNAMTRHRAGRAFIQGREHMDDFKDDPFLGPGAGSMLIGRKVLAQKQTDGHYYKAEIKSQLSGCTFLMEFSPPSDDVNPIVQETSLEGVMTLEDAQRHPVETGDHVLVAQVDCGGRYLPALVATGHEERDIKYQHEDQPLTVQLFGKGKEVSVEKDTAIWIAPPVYQLLCDLPPTRPTENNSQENVFITQGDNSESQVYNKFETPVWKPLINSMSRLDKLAPMNLLQSCPPDPKPLGHHHCHNYRNYDERCWPTSDSHLLPMTDMPVFPRGSKPAHRSRVLETRQEIEAKARRLREARESGRVREEKWAEEHGEEVDEDWDSDLEELVEAGGRPTEKDSDEDDYLEETYAPKTSFDICTEDNFRQQRSSYGPSRNVGVITDRSLLCAIPRKRVSKLPKEPWRYWAGEHIPDIMDPPVREPYEEAKVFAHTLETNRRDSPSKMLLEHASPAFHLGDPGASTHSYPRKMYDLFRHRTHESSGPLKRDASTGRETINPWLSEAKRWERKTKYQHGGYPNLGNHRVPTQDSVRDLLSDYREPPPLSAPQPVDNSSELAAYRKEVKKNLKKKEKALKKQEKKEKEEREENLAKIENQARSEEKWMKDPVQITRHSRMTRIQIIRAE